MKQKFKEGDLVTLNKDIDILHSVFVILKAQKTLGYQKLIDKWVYKVLLCEVTRNKNKQKTFWFYESNLTKFANGERL